MAYWCRAYSVLVTLISGWVVASAVHGLTCGAGWDGNTCKRQNVALNRTAKQGSNGCYEGKCFHADNAVNGNIGHLLITTPCTRTDPGAGNTVWNVTLEKTYLIYRFSIYNRKHDGNAGDCCGDRLSGFQLSVGMTAGLDNNYRLCYRDITTGSKGPGDVITRTCSSPIYGDLVQIKLPENSLFPLILCEVLIYVCSPGWYGEMCDKLCHTDDNCSKCTENHLECAECNLGKWGVDCERKCGNCWNNNQCGKVGGVCSKTSSDQYRCEAGFNDSQCIQACTAGSYGPDCRETCGSCRAGPDACARDTGICRISEDSFRCSDGYRGKNCKNVCEQGTFGENCSSQCGHCAGGQDKCSNTNGSCPNMSNPRCAAGYTGYLCTSSCSVGQYGGDCTEMCGQCAAGSLSCAKDSGICPEISGSSKCSPGYKGDICNDSCDLGEYGAECSRQCGMCLSGPRNCDVKSGKCSGMCLSGYIGELCNITCAEGSYGNTCNETCGACKGGNSMCNHVDGRCSNCEPGWQGEFCKQECLVGTWGENCENNCSLYCKSGPKGCDIHNGTCVDGCADGLTGHTCEPVPQTDDPDDPSTEAIVGGTVTAVVAAILVVISIFIIIKRRRNFPQETEESGNELRPAVALPNAVQSGRGGEYYNVPAFHEGRSAVPVDELEAYVRSKRADDKLSAEYEGLPKGLQANCEVAKKAENKGKSRYQNIVAYDHSRVVLDPLDEDPHSDYINACYIHGHGEINKYVASQGPTGIIVNDFWRTIWQVNTGKVVMLTNLTENLKKKCELYWPISVSDVSEFGLIRVTLFHEDVYADFTVRTLHVTNKKHPGQRKEIKQFHFTAWPDHGVPTQATGLLNFLDKVNSAKSNLRGPIFIHCSAGIGRTGTFIGLDYLINQANNDGVVDVPACVRLMREQRTNMIQTVGQYEFLYDALIEAIKLFNCSISSADFHSVYLDICIVNPDTGQTKLQEQFKALGELSTALKTADLKTASNPLNLPKSRYPTIMADCVHEISYFHKLLLRYTADSVRPFLSTPVSGCNNYINAVFLPAYTRKRAFIITQMPLPETIVDFWRLIHEQDVRTVVMLDTAEMSGKDIGLYWPESSAQYGPFDVETLDVENGDSFVIRNLNFQYKKEKDNANIKQFQSTFWKEDTMVPGSIRSFITLIQEVERWQQQSGNGPIIVHCMDGATKSGLFCAVSSIIERLKVDQEVNILQTLKQIRANRPEIVHNMEQFQFIHEVVLAYLESFQTYANFQ